jgi:peptidoglycan/LPS O-acetylase OafA/YrhL
MTSAAPSPTEPGPITEGHDAARTTRLLHIDHLRNGVILGLILFHTARLFDSEAWHIKDAGRFQAAELLIAAFNVVQMPLLFFLAGMTAFHSLGNRGAWRFARERLVRLLLPLVVGILLVVPPQVYVERLASGLSGRMSPIDFSGSFAAFYPSFFTCCYPAASFSWHHLWFVLYLFVYSLALLPLFLGLRHRAAAAQVDALGRWLAGGARLLLLALPIIVIELVLRRSFPSTHALVNDFANHAHFMTLMLLGWLFAASPDLARAATRLWRPVLTMAVALIAVLLTLRATGTVLPIEARQALRALAEWSAIAGLLGWGADRLNRPIPFLTGFSALSFPFYVFHQMVIVLLGFWLLGWSDAPLAKYLAIAALSLVISLALARAAGLSRPTRLMFGMRG